MTINELKIYQISLSSLSRLIFIYSSDTIYPLILDLNHCFYDTFLDYDNNSKKAKRFEWDFKNEQSSLKSNIIIKIS
ncbi:MAG: hypothetical protein K2L64_01090 [Ureaplasma sp.]|nr:hypothetical protein [Ureaplasma sp.]